jgi:hypothetical protein
MVCIPRLPPQECGAELQNVQILMLRELSLLFLSPWFPGRLCLQGCLYLI